MCVVIDANVASKFAGPPEDDVKPVYDRLRDARTNGHAVIGGKLRIELLGKRGAAGDVEAVRRLFAILQRQGRLIDYHDEIVDTETFEGE